MNDMKKLSMLAAGVAVLSMCACTEANEFTPSTNNSTKKITEIKVSSNPSALGTRTAFDTSKDNFGAVKWEEGDKLYFFKNGTNTNPQIFACDAEDNVTYSTEPQNQYDWNSFTAEGTGLEVDGNYYAYYIPHLTENFSDYKFSYQDFVVNHHLDFGNSVSLDAPADKPLSEFMKHYDFLVSSESRNLNNAPKAIFVVAKENMDPIFMDHAFALVTVDLKLKDIGSYTNYYQIPCYSEAELRAENVENNTSTSCLQNNFEINGNGALVFNDTEFIKSAFDPYYYYYLIPDSKAKDLPEVTNLEGNVPIKNKASETMSFYFLVHQNPEKQVNKLAFKIKSKSYINNFGMSVDKNVEITFSEGVNFISGNCYHFGLSVNYAVDGGTGDYNFQNHWQNKVGQITLSSVPDAMKKSIKEVKTYN